MMSISEQEEILETAVAGIPRVAQLIAAMPAAEQRAKALDAAKCSYLRTVQDFGYGDAAAQKWVFAVVRHLRAEVGGAIVTEAIENIRRGVALHDSDALDASNR
jgi:hypothetical protein